MASNTALTVADGPQPVWYLSPDVRVLRVSQAVVNAWSQLEFQVDNPLVRLSLILDDGTSDPARFAVGVRQLSTDVTEPRNTALDATLQAAVNWTTEQFVQFLQDSYGPVNVQLDDEPEPGRDFYFILTRTVAIPTPDNVPFGFTVSNYWFTGRTMIDSTGQVMFDPGHVPYAFLGDCESPVIKSWFPPLSPPPAQQPYFQPQNQPQAQFCLIPWTPDVSSPTTTQEGHGCIVARVRGATEMRPSHGDPLDLTDFARVYAMAFQEMQTRDDRAQRNINVQAVQRLIGRAIFQVPYQAAFDPQIENTIEIRVKQVPLSKLKSHPLTLGFEPKEIKVSQLELSLYTPGKSVKAGSSSIKLTYTKPEDHLMHLKAKFEKLLQPNEIAVIAVEQLRKGKFLGGLVIVFKSAKAPRPKPMSKGKK